MGTKEPRLDQHDDGLTSTSEWSFSEYTRKAATAIAISVFAVLAVVIVWRVLNILLIIFAAILLAVFLRGLTNTVAEKTPLSHGWALFSVTLLLLGLAVGGSFLLAPTVSQQVSAISEKIPQSLDALKNWVSSTPIGQPVLKNVPNPSELVSGGSLGWSSISGAFSSVAGVVTDIFFVVFGGIYLAVDPATYKRGLVRLVPMHYRARSEEVLDTVSHQLGWWLVGRLLSMLAVAVLTTLGLWIVGVPMALVIGLLSGLLSFVPIIGPLVSFVPAALVALLQGPQYVLYTAIVYLAVQSLESYLITPLIQQRTVSLPPALILIAQLLAGLLYGIIGVIVATPVAVLLIAVINLVYIEDILGDKTEYAEKIPGHGDGRELTGEFGSGAEPDPA